MASVDEARKASSPSPSHHEFFAALPLLSVALFALNNFLLKRMFPGFLTGKLSDLLFCFFMPLFVSAVLARLCRLAVPARVAIGIATTGLALTAVKTSTQASHALDQAIFLVVRPLGVHPAPNRVDPSDLIALPMLLVAWLYARARVAKEMV